jgi:predicted  nucleic acid-binding Zn-ribbon protein
LQGIDQALAHAHERLQEIDLQLAGNRKLQTLRRSVESLTARASSSRGRSRDLELESQSVREKITATQERLYGGRVTNPRELASLQDEIGYLERRQTRIEDDLLEAMIRLDEQTSELREEQERLDQAVAEWEATRAALRAQQSELEAQLEVLNDQRATVRESIQTQDLSLYEDLRRRKQGTAVVLVEDQICGGCGMRLPSSVIQQARQTEIIHLCPSCGRILSSQ